MPKCGTWWLFWSLHGIPEVKDVEIGLAQVDANGNYIGSPAGMPLHTAKLKANPSSDTSGSIVLYNSSKNSSTGEFLNLFPEVEIATYYFADRMLFVKANETVQNLIIPIELTEGVVNYYKYASMWQEDLDYLFNLIFTESESGYSQSFSFNIKKEKMITKKGYGNITLL